MGSNSSAYREHSDFVPIQVMREKPEDVLETDAILGMSVRVTTEFEKRHTGTVEHKICDTRKSSIRRVKGYCIVGEQNDLDG